MKKNNLLIAITAGVVMLASCSSEKFSFREKIKVNKAEETVSNTKKKSLDNSKLEIADEKTESTNEERVLASNTPAEAFVSIPNETKVISKKIMKSTPQDEKISVQKNIQKLAPKKIEETKNANKTAGNGKSQIVALILVLLVGGLGIHRFYLGYTWQGVVQLLTFGGCGIWTLIDLIRIVTGDLKPKNGSYDQTL